MNEKKLTRYLLKRLRKYSLWTYMHSVRVNDCAIGIGRYLGLGFGELETLSTAAKLYDIGKMAVPVDILDKAAMLTKVEGRGETSFLFTQFTVPDFSKTEAISDSIDVTGQMIQTEGNDTLMEAAAALGLK